MSNLYLGPLTVTQTSADFGGVSVLNVNSISVASAPLQDQNLANKQYVDNQITTLATDRLNALVSGSTLQLDSLVEIVDYFNGLDAAAAGNVTSAVSNIQNSISAEETRALAAETTLQSNIDAELQRALIVEGLLQTNLNIELLRAVAAEGLLQSNLDTEALRAQAAEALLQSNLDTEALRAREAEGVLLSNLDAEALRAQAAEALLQSNANAAIYDETQRAMAAESLVQSSLTQVIDLEVYRAQAAESALEVYSRDTRARLDALYMYFKHHDSSTHPSTGVPF